MADRATLTSLGSGDTVRRRTGYYPPWLDNLADVTMKGSVLAGIVRGRYARYFAASVGRC
ncbi:hypothetical protein [Streptomyces sp. NPDC002088]|uniref:hypothetical protein n=1 Tax=Streptomyces sp. NPDC002088 TaxID=3154665 RepID=UPI00331810C1